MILGRLITFFLIIILAYSSPTQAKSSKDEVKIVTMNIYCVKNNWKFRLREILRRIVSISPDIVSFQEVCIGEDQNQVKFISDFLKSSNYPLKIMKTQFTHKSWNIYDEYILTFSKHFTKVINKGFLPRSPLQRGYLALNINGIWYVNTHLEHRPDYFNYRKQQIEFLVNKFKNHPHLIMGDFNSSPKTKEQRAFHYNNYNAFFPGPTHLGEDGNTMRDIDGFWSSSQLNNMLYPEVAKIILNKKVNNVYLSDHFGVYLHLKYYWP